jgi:hypothetical protein
MSDLLARFENILVQHSEKRIAALEDELVQKNIDLKEVTGQNESLGVELYSCYKDVSKLNSHISEL